MEIGTIFKWYKYPFLQKEGPKDIWGLYWGKTNPFDEPVYVLFHKITSRNYHYEYGGGREFNKHHTMPKTEYAFFDAEHSIIDFNFPMEIRKETEYNKATIEVIHKLPEDKIRFFYNHIKESYTNIEYNIKCRIMENLKNAGLNNLDKPKRNIKRPY